MERIVTQVHLNVGSEYYNSTVRMSECVFWGWGVLLLGHIICLTLTYPMAIIKTIFPNANVL